MNGPNCEEGIQSTKKEIHIKSKHRRLGSSQPRRVKEATDNPSLSAKAAQMRTLREILSEEKLGAERTSQSDEASEKEAEPDELDDKTKRSLFYLLSKKFSTLPNKRYFLDQIELIILKKKLRSSQIKSILKKENVKVDMDSVFLDENNSSFQNKTHANPRKGAKTGILDPKLDRLERVLTLYRADQLFAPLMKLVDLRVCLFERHFFLNTRLFAKLAPFRKIHSLIEAKLTSTRRSTWTRILFCNKTCVKLRLVCALISKSKLRVLANSFKEICFFSFKQAFLMQKREAEQPGRERFPTNFSQNPGHRLEVGAF